MIRVRKNLERLVLLGSVALLAFVGAQSAGAAVVAAPCAATQLVGKVRQSSGAAGTIALSIRVRNVSNATCSIRGFPLLKLRNNTRQIPTLVRHGGLAILDRPVQTVTLAPGTSGSLLVTYSDVPTGTETHCRKATRLVVILGNGQGRFSLAFAGSPCNQGLLHESPFLKGLQDV
jgi:hypothetical protein